MMIIQLNDDPISNRRAPIAVSQSPHGQTSAQFFRENPFYYCFRSLEKMFLQNLFRAFYFFQAKKFFFELFSSKKSLSKFFSGLIGTV